MNPNLRLVKNKLNNSETEKPKLQNIISASSVFTCFDLKLISNNQFNTSYSNLESIDSIEDLIYKPNSSSIDAVTSITIFTKTETSNIKNEQNSQPVAHNRPPDAHPSIDLKHEYTDDKDIYETLPDCPSAAASVPAPSFGVNDGPPTSVRPSLKSTSRNISDEPTSANLNLPDLGESIPLYIDNSQTSCTNWIKRYPEPTRELKAFKTGGIPPLKHLNRLIEQGNFFETMQFATVLYRLEETDAFNINYINLDGIKLPTRSIEGDFYSPLVPIIGCFASIKRKNKKSKTSAADIRQLLQVFNSFENLQSEFDRRISGSGKLSIGSLLLQVIKGLSGEAQYRELIDKVLSGADLEQI